MDFLKTTPKDRKRFPAVNQANYCWNLYNEWALCVKKNEGDTDACLKARQAADSVCPDEWLENWDGQRDDGNYPGIK
eukprot:CAMPEP_0117872092 /NCGR_PEP_ID=MMETSP0950-20121206/10880_1 /TAXON_ID=44440 /ORGANISM="Chattonella subsalsa, Strain CCMP2191" /LENGTH=76 /DNA_ID=CAMNT_0005724805 /DNA_START=61 /DNA_END=291 /DNA_ORIENTATION=-